MYYVTRHYEIEGGGKMIKSRTTGYVHADHALLHASYLKLPEGYPGIVVIEREDGSVLEVVDNKRSEVLI